MTIIQTLLVFVAAPALLYVLIAVFVYAPSKAKRRSRYRPGQPWEFAPQWWAGDQAVVSQGSVTPARPEEALVAPGDDGVGLGAAAPPAAEVATLAQAPNLVRQVGPGGGSHTPLTSVQLELLDDVIREAELFTGLRFSVYLGDLGENTRATADSLLSGLGADAPSAALIAVSPGQRVVEVVTGAEASRRITDRAARLAVLAVVASCSDGDVAGALITGVRILADQAGTLPDRVTW